MVDLGITSQPVVDASEDGRLELFTFGSDWNLYHIWQTDLSDHWSSWSSHGTTGEGLFSIPALAADANKQLQLFATTISDETGANSLVNLPQTAPNNGWGPWRDFGGPATGRFLEVYPPALGPSADGQLELFVFTQEQDPNLYHIWQASPSGDWTGSISHGHPSSSTLSPGSLTVASNADGRLVLFAVGNDGNLYHIEQTSVNSTGSSGWSDWYSHGHGLLLDTSVPALVLAPNADKRLELFVGGPVNLARIWQTVPSAGWSDWQDFSLPPVGTFTSPFEGRPVLARDPDQKLVLFVLAEGVFLSGEKDFYYKKQTSTDDPNGGVWSDWISLGHP